jgi:dynein assembly factor 1, axonemal
VQLVLVKMEMTTRVLRDICKQNNLYRTPHLNDKLYLNFQGFCKIENLDPYYGLNALFLDGNALTSLEGMPRLEELKCL